MVQATLTEGGDSLRGGPLFDQMENQSNEVQTVSKCLSSNTSFSKIHPQSKILYGSDEKDLIKLENHKWGPKAYL